MARKYLGSPYRSARRLDRKEPFDELLHDAEGVTVGFTSTYPDELDKAAAEIEADDELSPVGKQRALKKLVAEYESHPDVRGICDPWIARAEKEAQRLNDLLDQRPPIGDATPDERMELWSIRIASSSRVRPRRTPRSFVPLRPKRSRWGFRLRSKHLRKPSARYRGWWWQQRCWWQRGRIKFYAMSSSTES